MTTGRPDWVSDDLYPFGSRFFETPDGQQMHYVDEGKGPTIVFVHGNPSWSFEFRHLIADLRSDHRCIALDHIGFGLSSRSDDAHDHHPHAHARRFAALMDHLQLEDATLFMSDWGGPIGLDYVRRRPARVSKLALANTWCWPVNRDRHFLFFSFMMWSPLGQYLIKRRNCFVNGVMPRAIAVKSAITPEMMEHYRRAQPTPTSRAACAALPGRIISASRWLSDIWEDRERFADKPTLIFWGLQDIAFRRRELERWRASLDRSEVHDYSDVGHFVAEEAPDRVIPALRDFVR
jgi:haloalkane dehalogenase